MPTKIEELWHSLRGDSVATQRRVDAEHPLDLYADFEPPDRPGLVLVCVNRPPDFQSLQAIRIERRQRHDGRWVLRVSLDEPKLIMVFTELCRDIVDFTRTGAEPERAGSIVLSRIERWRSLLLSGPAGLDRSTLRGLIGELLVLENRILPQLGPDEGISAWTGPLGMEHDFRLPSGQRLEVKAVDRDADRVVVNGLDQLDGGENPLILAVVRLEETGRDAPNAVTAPLLIERLRARLVDAPAALYSFNGLLRFVGWDDANEAAQVIVRFVKIDEYEMDTGFPRLIPATVPDGVVDATYTIVLPRQAVAQ